MSRIKERLKQYHDEYSKYSKYDGILIGDAVDMLEQLQDDLEQDEKENRWISVDEKLPDASDFVLTALKETNSSGCDYSIGSLIKQNGAKRWLDDFYGILNSESKYKVVAWRPLPEPYKGDQP